MSAIRRGSLVIVDWLDAHTPSPGWDAPKRKDFKPERVRSVGFVVNADAKALTLCGDGAPKRPHKDSVNRPITIPLGMITRVREVRLSECRVIR